MSRAGRVVGLYPPTYGVYAATKAGVEAMTHVLAKEMRGRDITVCRNGMLPARLEQQYNFVLAERAFETSRNRWRSTLALDAATDSVNSWRHIFKLHGAIVCAGHLLRRGLFPAHTPGGVIFRRFEADAARL